MQQEIEDKCTRNRKRGPQPIQSYNRNKRPRFDTDNIQEQVKSAIMATYPSFPADSAEEDTTDSQI